MRISAVARASGARGGSVGTPKNARASEPHLPGALAEQAPREPDGVDDRRRDPPAGELTRGRGRRVEAGVVRHDRRVARERQAAASVSAAPSSAAGRIPVRTRRPEAPRVDDV
jgi:hypothetical protein